MKKNRKRNRKMSVSASRTVHLAAVVMMLFVMVIVNILVSSRNDQIMKSIGEKTRVLKSLEKDRIRESGKWEQMRDSTNLDRVLSKLAMPMKYPKSYQIIHMDAAGRPIMAKTIAANDRRRRGEKTSLAQSAPRAKPSSVMRKKR